MVFVKQWTLQIHSPFDGSVLSLKLTVTNTSNLLSFNVVTSMLMTDVDDFNMLVTVSTILVTSNHHWPRALNQKDVINTTVTSNFVANIRHQHRYDPLNQILNRTVSYAAHMSIFYLKWLKWIWQNITTCAKGVIFICCSRIKMQSSNGCV